MIRDDNKSVYAASATPLPHVKISPDFDMDSDEASGDNKHDQHRSGNNPLNMPGY